MEKEFIPYEQALALKELGFDEPCLKGFFNFVNTKSESYITELLSPKVHIFGEDYLFRNSVDFIDEPSMAINHHPICNKNCSAPTFSQAFRWFRDKYGMEGVTQRAEDFMWYKWTIHQYNENSKKYVANWYKYKTYEEAELECLIKLIELVKNK